MYGLPEQNFSVDCGTLIATKINFGAWPYFCGGVCVPEMAGENRIKFGAFKDLFMCLSLHEVQYYMIL